MEGVPKIRSNHVELKEKGFFEKAKEKIQERTRSRFLRYMLAAGMSLGAADSIAQKVEGNPTVIPFDSIENKELLAKSIEKTPVEIALEKIITIENSEDAFEKDLLHRDLLPNAEHLDADFEDIQTAASVHIIDGEPTVLYQKNGVYKTHSLTKHLAAGTLNGGFTGVGKIIENISPEENSEQNSHNSKRDGAIYQIHTLGVLTNQDSARLYRNLNFDELETVQNAIREDNPEKYSGDKGEEILYQDAMELINKHHGVDVEKVLYDNSSNLTIEFELSNEDVGNIKEIQKKYEDVYERNDAVNKYVQDKYVKLLGYDSYDELLNDLEKNK